MKTLLVITTITTLSLLVLGGCSTLRSAYATAPYRVTATEGAFELREYPVLVVAETSMPELASRGADGSFGRLFRYISGGNAAQEKIAMTTPVFMTGAGDQAAMAFVLPSSVPAARAPQPADDSVHLREIPSGTFAVYRFSGGRSSAREADARNQLAAWMRSASLAPAGAPVFAYFDPPWTPSFLRRNEVMLRVSSPKL